MEARPREADIRDPLGAALLPVLMHRLNNATQLLATLNALIADGGGTEWLERRAADLAQTSRTIEELGYLLAVVASASGTELLLERRERRGLALVVAAVEGALRREGRRLDRPAGELPDLAPEVGRGWELPWAVGALLLASGRQGEAAEDLAFRLGAEGEGWVLVIERAPGKAVRALAAAVGERLPEVALELGPDSLRLRLPARWLRPMEAP